jgi:hypothetical protein
MFALLQLGPIKFDPADTTDACVSKMTYGEKLGEAVRRSGKYMSAGVREQFERFDSSTVVGLVLVLVGIALFGWPLAILGALGFSWIFAKSAGRDLGDTADGAAAAQSVLELEICAQYFARFVGVVGINVLAAFVGGVGARVVNNLKLQSGARYFLHELNKLNKFVNKLDNLELNYLSPLSPSQPPMPPASVSPAERWEEIQGILSLINTSWFQRW